MILPHETSGEAPLFPVGELGASRNAIAVIPYDELLLALGRHMNGDWGNVDAEDHAANERALQEGTRIFSVYHTRQGVKFWIITEADRSRTTILLPEDF